MKMYRVWLSQIEPIEAERVTDQSVWINGRRNALRTEWSNFFQTWRDARAFMEDQAMRKVLDAKCQLDRARSALEVVKAMKPPQETP